MSANTAYRTPDDLPSIIPVFPLSGALLLPRVPMPLNIFEPRYLRMIDDALKGSRIIGMIQPEEGKSASASHPNLYAIGCAGKITQFSETGDGRYLITLNGIARFNVVEEIPTTTPYRQCRVDFKDFAGDLVANRGEEAVDRDALLRTLTTYLSKNKIEADWKGVREAPTEALVNGLSMMSPYGSREKQALLEAPDLKTRAELLVAVTEVALAKADNNDLSLQ
jgi:Lon protease-like protein